MFGTHPYNLPCSWVYRWCVQLLWWATWLNSASLGSRRGLPWRRLNFFLRWGSGGKRLKIAITHLGTWVLSHMYWCLCLCHRCAINVQLIVQYNSCSGIVAVKLLQCNLCSVIISTIRCSLTPPGDIHTQYIPKLGPNPSNHPLIAPRCYIHLLGSHRFEKNGTLWEKKS